MTNEQLLKDLKKILEEDYGIKLSNKSLDKISEFLINYTKILYEYDLLPEK